VSTFAPARLRCRKGHQFPVDVAESLHISNRPDLRQQILDGTFHRFTCPQCAAHVGVEKLLAYTDFPRRHWFTVVPPPELFHWRHHAAFAEKTYRLTMVEHAPPIVQGWSQEFLTRLVFGLDALRETLVILDAGLHDRWVAALKLFLVDELRIVRDPMTIFMVTAVEADGTLVFDYRPPGQAALVPLRVDPQDHLLDIGTVQEPDDPLEALVTDWRTSLVPVA
jgi:hypothetical protein